MALCLQETAIALKKHAHCAVLTWSNDKLLSSVTDGRHAVCDSYSACRCFTHCSWRVQHVYYLSQSSTACRSNRVGAMVGCSLDEYVAYNLPHH